ncbi:MAG: molybdopterin-dependent oxidoreductase [Candidatus Eremiobacteraeota bacterium]|nr:molybdopterin-dependent oxidoreductase [Candidatus Eremiobacteraeota bacterium]
MRVHTYNEKVNDGRRAVLEFLLLNHPLDCPICDKGGECDLQDFSMAYGQSASRLADAKVAKPKAVDLGPTIVLDEERCIVCQRCVRFDDIITRERSLIVKDRGARDIIATATGTPYRSNFSGNVTELCPVGALTSKTYRFKSRPWDLHRTRTTCMQCSVGCQLHIDEREKTVLRTMSVETDDAISDGWLCDRGRYNIGFYADERRLRMPLYKHNGEWLEMNWEEAIAMWAAGIKDAIAEEGPQSVGAIGGGRLLNEEAFLLQDLHRKLGVSNLDWRAGRQRQATPGNRGGSLPELENAQAIVVLGESPSETAPILDLRIRKAVYQRGAVLIAVASTAAPSPVPLINAASLSAAWSAIPHSAHRIAVVWDGVDSAAGLELERFLDENADRQEVITYIAAEQPNGRGAETMGMHPGFAPGFRTIDSGLDSALMFERAAAGGMRVCSILGANPLLHFGNGALVRSALQKTPFVVVSDLFMTQTAELASLVLPARASFEKTGTTINLAGDVLPVNAGVEPPEGTGSDLEMLIALCDALGLPLPSMASLEQEVIAHLAHDPLRFGFGDPVICGTPRSIEPRGNGLRLVAERRMFGGGGTAAFDERIAGLRPLPQAALSIADANRLGVATSDYVDLQSYDQTMHDLLVEVRPGLEPGSVVVIDGLPDEPANALAPGSCPEVVNVRKTAGELIAAGAVR